MYKENHWPDDEIVPLLQPDDVIDAASRMTTGGRPGSTSKPIPEDVLGCVASPARYEATTKRFYFWVRRNKLVEATQLVRTESDVSGACIGFYGVVEEVNRSSGRRSFEEERDVKDGDPTFEAYFKPDGTTYCEVTILRTEPSYLTPPIEESIVYLGGPDAAAQAYGYDSLLDPDTGADWGLAIGLLRNGGVGKSGPAKIDVRDLCGDRAGHLNVTGQAGHGTKSSFLLVVLWLLLRLARRRDDGNPKVEPFSVRPIVFNAKGNDLMYIDQRNRYLNDALRADWQAMGVDDPSPFVDAAFYAPCRAGSSQITRDVARVQRPVAADRQTRAYYWTLADVVRFGLWPYLFSDDTQQSETMSALADHLLDLIAEDCEPDYEFPAGLRLREPSNKQGAVTPQSFTDLVGHLHAALRDNSHAIRDGRVHTFGTCRALLSRLGVVRSSEGRVIFDDGPGLGAPLRVTAQGTTDPMVIDIAGLPVELRRFVVAAVLDQVKNAQMGANRIHGQVYVLVLDELGVYAPRGGRDAITRLFEYVAAQLRSQGIILFSAQQQASKVSETILINSEFKALGAIGSEELDAPAWSRLLTATQKLRAQNLGPEDKMVRGPQGWMNVIVPFPSWPMKKSEMAPPTEDPGDGGDSDDFGLNLPEA